MTSEGTVPKTGASRMRQSGLAIGVLIAIGFAIQYLPGQLSPSAPPPVGQPIAAVTMPDPLTARAQSALDRILGPGRSVITASATVGVASNQSSTRFDAIRVERIQDVLMLQSPKAPEQHRHIDSARLERCGMTRACAPERSSMS